MRWEIGLDLGSSCARMAVSGRGGVLREASAVAYRHGERSPLLWGEAARALEGRTPAEVAVCYPIADGVVEVDHWAVELVRALLARAATGGRLRRGAALVACPGRARQADRRVLATAVMAGGAGECYLAPSALAAALGAGVDVLAPEASLVMELGADCIGATLFSLGRVVAERYRALGMRSVDEAIAHLARTQKGVALGRATCEELKRTLGAALGAGGQLDAEAIGLSLREGFPRPVRITAEEVRAALAPVIEAAAQLAEAVVRHAPVELAADLSEGELVLTGGGAQLTGLDRLLQERLGMTCRVAEDPEGCTVRGLERMMNEPERLGSFVVLGRPLVAESK